MHPLDTPVENNQLLPEQGIFQQYFLATTKSITCRSDQCQRSTRFGLEQELLFKPRQSPVDKGSTLLENTLEQVIAPRILPC